MSSFGERVHSFHQNFSGSPKLEEARSPFKQYHFKALCYPSFLCDGIGSFECRDARQLVSTTVYLSFFFFFLLIIVFVYQGKAHFTLKLSYEFQTVPFWNEIHACNLNSAKIPLASWDSISFLLEYVIYKHFISLNST